MSDDDNSNDVVLLENIEEPQAKAASTEAEDNRPLMQLFQRLISSDNKHNTVLTNMQIIAILEKEFDMDIATMHDLEVDIYLNVVKKFLKDWPQWDEFDHSINSLKKQNAHKFIMLTLEKKYRNLKEYLNEMIDMVRPLAQEAVIEMQLEQAKEMENVDTSKVVLEVHCTRQQLNQVILSQPVDNNVFNYIENQQKVIYMGDIPLESIFNSHKIQIKIEFKWFSYTRNATHQMQHMLINKKNGSRNLKRVLNENVQYKINKGVNPAQQRVAKKTDLVEVFDEILRQIEDSEYQAFFQSLFSVIIKDFNNLERFKVQGWYRQHCCIYPYYRKLRKEPDSEPPSGSNYDLYIEETIAPLITFMVSKLQAPSSLPSNFNGVTIACGECDVRFSDKAILNLKKHFLTCHTNELPWICTNCEKSFPHTQITKARWQHDCDASST